MSSKITVAVLENSERRWEGLTGRISSLPGKYLYIASPHEVPDMERIRGMLSGIPGSADLIVPVPHTRHPAGEQLEEKAVHSIFYIHERFGRAPLLNGRLIRKKFLLKCLAENPHDWIHAPCPDLFLLCFCPGRAAAVRSDYSYDPESFTEFCRSYRSAPAWLENRTELSEEAKEAFQARVLQYGSYLLQQVEELNLQDFQAAEFFDPGLIGYALFAKCPDRLSGIRPDPPGIRPGPVRRLAVFCWALRAGGAERCTSLLLRHFSSLPDLKIFLFLSRQPEPGDYPCPENVEITVLPYRFYARRARLSRLLTQKNIDTCLFIDHSLANTYYDILTAGELGIRTVAMEHSTISYPLHDFDLQNLMPLRQFGYLRTNIVTCLSRFDEYIWNSRGINARYMPNPLTFDIGDRPPFTERKNKNLIFISRMVPGKGVLDALKTVEEVRKRHPEVRLFMLGGFPDPDFERKMQDYVREHHLEEAVEFTGFTTEVGRYLAQSSIHLMPSSIEGYPMTLMEAKSYGLPTVAYSLPYLEAGREEYGTLMVPQGDHSAMAEKVSGLLDDFGKLNEMARKTYACLTCFDNQKVFAHWNALFHWLETGTEPDDLKLPQHPDEAKLRWQQMMTDEIISAAMARYASPAFMEKIAGKEIDSERRENILFDQVMKLYSLLQKNLRPGSWRCSIIKAVFVTLFRLKRLYRFFKPWKDKEQDL